MVARRQGENDLSFAKHDTTCTPDSITGINLKQDEIYDHALQSVLPGTAEALLYLYIGWCFLAANCRCVLILPFSLLWPAAGQSTS